MNKQRGFTLIEVMVALVIVGIALPAMLLRMQGVIDGTAHIRAKTYAFWLAENKRQEMIITQKLQRNVVKTKKRQGSEEFAGQEWFWKIEIEETAIPKMYRMEIAVGLDDDASLATLSGFVNE